MPGMCFQPHNKTVCNSDSIKVTCTKTFRVLGNRLLERSRNFKEEDGSYLFMKVLNMALTFSSKGGCCVLQIVALRKVAIKTAQHH